MKRMLAFVIGLLAIGAIWCVHRSSRPVLPSIPSEPLLDVRRPDRTNVPTLEVPAAVSRATDEWQGMAIDELRPLCDTSERCGLATACVEGHCGGCTADRECASGEACVLAHCVRSELVACRSRADCNGDELCVLSGVSPDARGNRDTRAHCQGSTSEIAQSREAYEANQRARVGIAAPPREVTPYGLLETL